MKRLQTNYALGLWLLVIMCGLSLSADAQTGSVSTAGKSVTWLKNKPSVPDKRIQIPYYSEDAYYGIEKAEKTLLAEGYVVPSPAKETNGTGAGNGTGREGNGVGTGNGVGMGTSIGTGRRADNGSGLGAGSVSPEPKEKWVPYYDRPSNCATADYQPALDQALIEAAATPVNRRAQLVRQPRALYSHADYLTGRQGTIRLEVLLKANGTVGSV